MLSVSDNLAPALIRAILDIFPVLSPLFPPLKSPAATNTDLRLNAVFGLWGWAHGSSLIRLKRQVLDYASELQGNNQHQDSTDSVYQIVLLAEALFFFTASADLAVATEHSKQAKNKKRHWENQERPLC